MNGNLIPPEDIKIDFNNNLLNQIIFHCIHNSHFLSKIRSVFPIHLFKSSERICLMEMIFEYYDQYKTAPKENFFDIFKEKEKVMRNDLYKRTVELIGLLKDLSGSNSEYILGRIEQAIMHFQLEEASVEFASLIKRKKYDKARELMNKALKPPQGIQEDYFDYSEDKEYIRERSEGKRFKMSTDIKGLDKIIGGINPPWLVTILGASKGGKTWGLIEMATTALFQGLNVVFFSLEMNKTQVKARFDQNIGFLSSQENNEPVDTMIFDNNKWQKRQAVLKSIYDIPLVEKNASRLKKVTKGKLKIVAYNRGRINYHDVTRILDTMEQNDNFVPDVLVVDYLGIMRKTEENQSKKDRITENCLGLKDICGERNMICFTAMQGNRSAMRSKTFRSDQIADDIDVIFTSDLVLAICQTPEEEKLNRYRYYIANFRHGPQFKYIGLIRDLTIGQPTLGEFEVNEDGEEDDAAPPQPQTAVEGIM